MRDLQAVKSFKLTHYQRESPVSEIKKKQVKKNKILYS